LRTRRKAPLASETEFPLIVTDDKKTGFDGQWLTLDSDPSAALTKPLSVTTPNDRSYL
jgi:hypothetical protein